MNKVKGLKFFSVVIAIGILTYLCFAGATIPKTSIIIPKVRIPYTNTYLPSVIDLRTGIDIRGGVRAVLGAPSGYTPTDAELETVRNIIEKRLDAKKIYDRTIVTEQMNGHIIVEIPWKSGETDFDPQKAVEEIGKTALLTFREYDPSKVTYQDGEIVPTGDIIVQGTDIVNAEPTINPETNEMFVVLELSKDAQKKFEEATERLINQQIAIYLDNQVISAPRVNSKIPAGSPITITLGLDANSKDAPKVARDLAATIRSGALPFKLEIKEVNAISSILGESALRTCVIAGAVAITLVWVFMLSCYRVPGVIADIALLAHTVIQLLVLSWLGISITLPGIAGIILSIGMGVDANVIIFARIKEELKAGKTLPLAIDIGFKKAFEAVFDANMTSLIAAVVLYIFGSGPIQSFAITLGLGVVLSFLTAVTASRIMIKSVSGINITKHKWLYGA
ncbi:MAG: protein translocase subunit SecD [Clostridiales bacterium]|nr:protein translocase subunit SecD [Clostridiales bacterium]